MLTAILVVFWMTLFGATCLWKVHTPSAQKALPKPNYHQIELYEREQYGENFQAIFDHDVAMWGEYSHKCPGCDNCPPKPSVRERKDKVEKYRVAAPPAYNAYAGARPKPSLAMQIYDNNSYFVRPSEVPDIAESEDIRDWKGNVIVRIWTWYQYGQKMYYKQILPSDAPPLRKTNLAPAIPTTKALKF